MAEAADGGGRRHPVGFIDTLGVGCCTRLRTGTGRRSDGAGGKGGREGGVPSPQCFHESLTTTPGPVEVARRVNVTSPPDADTIFSVVVPYKGYLYTPMGRGLGIERTYWPDGWALRWNASAAVALEALGAVLHEERVAAAAAALPAAAAPPAALASLAIRQTHHRLSADGGDLWVFDIDAAAVPTPHPALATRVAAAAARAAGKSPPLMVPHIHSGPMSTLKPTRLAWNVVVARPLVGDDTRHGHECTVATLPRPVATPLTLIVPYATRDSRLTAFLATYRVLRYSDPALSLLISTLPTEVAEVNRMVAAAALPLLPPEEAAMDTVPGPRSHHTNGVTVLSSGGDRDGTFSRSVAIRDAVASLSHDVLFFVTDVDLTVGPVAVHNCRANALAGGQAWFPIFWNYYAATPPGLSPSTGFWRTSSYGPVCAHRSSWDAVGGFGGNEEERFAGWGSEDVVAYQHFRDHPAMGVMRGLEPGLTHTWHAKTCARNAAHAACVRTLAMSMASQERLASLVLAQGGGGGGEAAPLFHASLATPPGPVEVARRDRVGSPPDGDTLFSSVSPTRWALRTLAGRGLGIDRIYWPDGWARRWTASAAVALDALGAALEEERAAAVAAEVAAVAAAAAAPAAAAARPPAALASLTILQTHHRLSADGGDVWVYDIDAVAAAATPRPADAAAVAAAAAAAAAEPPPLRGRAAAAATTPTPTPLAWKVVVSRPLVGDDTRTGRGCTVATLPLPVAAPVTLVVPYAGRPARLAAYLRTYGRLRSTDAALGLAIATLPAHVAEVHRLVAAASLPLLPPSQPPPLPQGGPAGSTAPPPAPSHLTHGVTVVTNGGDRAGAFSRSVAVRDAVAGLALDALFYVTDVDLTVSPDAVRNCRAHALAGGQVWYPIFWNYYAGTRPGLSPATGFWRTSSYGTVCAHRSSWDAVGGFGGNEEERFVGWGSEDVEAYQHFRDHPAMGVMRGLEPGLTHAWHDKACAPDDAAYDACRKTVAMSMASQQRLAELVVAADVDVAAALGVHRETGGGMG
ncbi:hypothetical protein I4F81_001775 [Pyropia yezoensis]|uniref:Uncharacterized protein n=1 Tax=Pyropia yezoensis TaxID=2788 RepID=A0ACC3BMP3_PYRYE|nr:hypothetical protein I4F81_001775 [Neopyropia yezoensis]